MKVSETKTTDFVVFNCIVKEKRNEIVPVFTVTEKTSRFLEVELT